MSQILSIDDVPRARRHDAWREIVSNTFVSLDCAVPEPDALRGTIATTGPGPLSMSLVDTVGQSVHRTRPLIRRDAAEVVLISFQLEGVCGLTQGEREVRLHAGEFALYDSTRPYSLRFDGAFRQLVLHLPREHMRRRLGPIHEVCARPAPTGRAACGVTSAYLAGLARALDGLEGPSVEDFGRIALDLLTHAFADAAPAHRPAAAVRMHAERIIARRFAEADLATPEIARAAGVSVRRLQEVFAEAGTTPMRALWSHRLSAAHALLRGGDAGSITDIGYRCGFAESAQLSRRFRARYGLTPREARRAPS